MRGVYEISGKFSVSANKTLAYFTAPASKCVEILSASATNTDNETNEQLEIKFTRITTLGTPTATSVTPTPTEPGDQASGITSKVNCTSEPTTYASGQDFGAEGFSSLGGWRFQPIPEERPVVAPAASVGLQLVTSPALGAITIDIRILVREIG